MTAADPGRTMMGITAAEWLAALRLPAEDIPDLVVVEGSWWREQRTRWRLGYLSDVRELAFPDMFWGRWKDRKVVFSCAYGAPRTVEVVHIFSAVGARLCVQIGTCGGLQPHLRTGDVILPAQVVAREGVAEAYGAIDVTSGSSEWLERARSLLDGRGHTTHAGPHVTSAALMTETAEMVRGWSELGCLGVDMETATTYAVSRHFGVPAVSMLVVWDDVIGGKRFLDPLTPAEAELLDRANTSVYEVALELAEHLP